MRLLHISLGLLCVFLPASPASENEYEADVLILGAGMSGISAAKTLYEKGVKNFTILEARDRIGGRMRSEEFGGIRVELGEQWIQGIHDADDPPRPLSDHNDFQKLVIERCGISGLQPDFNESRVFHAGPTIIDNKTVQEGIWEFGNLSIYADVEGLFRQMYGLPDISVRQAFTDNGWVPDTPFKKLLEWDFFDFLNQQIPETASVFRSIPNPAWANFGIEMRIITDQRGSEHLLRCMARDFGLVPDDPRLKLSTRVFRIRNENSSVCVDTVSGRKRKTYCAKYALVTFSIGVLQSPKVVKFVPRLPKWKLDAVNMFTMNHMVRIFLKYKKPFWDDVTFVDRTDNVKGRYPAFQPLDHYRYNISQSNPAHIIAWTVTGNQAEVITNQSLKKTRKEIREVFKEMYPDKSIPDPEEMLITNWRDNPLYFGSYPNKPVGSTNYTYDLLSYPVGRLFFGGDGTHKVYSGLLQGAYYSGIDAGRAIAKYMYYEELV